MTPAKSPRRHAEREESRARLIAEATRLFAERGMEKVTFGDIAKEAGLSRTLVYFYFKDQEQLVVEALEHALRELHQRFIAAIRPKHSGLDQLREIGRAYVRFNDESPSAFSLLAQCQAKNDPALGDGAARSAVEEAVDVHHRAILGLIVASVEKGRRDGSVRKDLGPPLETAFCLWAMVHGLIQLRATKGDKITEALGPGADGFVEAGLEMIRKSMRAK